MMVICLSSGQSCRAKLVPSEGRDVIDKKKDGWIALLEESDFNRENPWGSPVVGWKPTSQGVGGLFNPRGYAMLRAVLSKLVEEKRRSLYDQPVLVENAGSILIAELEGRVALVHNYRMVGERVLKDAGADYIKRLQERKLWNALLQTLGAWKWEAPRGLAPPIDREEGLTEFILRTAKLEGQSEAGLTVEDARVVGRVNANSTFFVHSQYVVHARITATGESSPEELEMLGEMKLFSMSELRQLSKAGEFDDGLTLAALALCGMSL